MRKILFVVGLLTVLLIAVANDQRATEAAPGGWSQAQVDAATQAGVAYIDTQFNPVPGNYGTTVPIAETGMALVGYSVVANGSFSNLSPTYQAHVTAAIAWLLTQQGGDGSWADFGFYQTYGTGIVLAGLSGFQSVNPLVPAAIANGRTFLINEFQGPAYTGCSSADGSGTAYYCGGWNYDTGAGRSDESNTGFAMFGLQLTGGIPGTVAPDNINWQHHIQEISTNPFATRNDGGGSYLPGINSSSFSSNANDTGTMLFGLGYDGVAGTDAHVMAGLTLGQDVLDEYELMLPARNMVYHSGANEDGTCIIGGSCDWNFSDGEGGYHYSLFSLTKGLGEYIPPNLTSATNWYAKVVDLLLTEQLGNGSWPQDGRDDGSILLATSFSVSALGLVAVPVTPGTPPIVKTPRLANLWLCQPVASCADPTNGIGERDFNVELNSPITSLSPKGEPQTIGSFEFQVRYDAKFVSVTVSAGPLLADADVNLSCAVTNGQGFVQGRCNVKGKGGEPIVGPGVLAIVHVRPTADVYSMLIPNQENGIATQLINQGCELSDLQGHPIATSVCGDAELTIRYLEGDLNADCAVNAQDQQQIAFRWGSRVGNLLYNSRFDLEPAAPKKGDGDIDAKDLQVVFGRHHSTCVAIAGNPDFPGPHPAQDPVDPKALPTPTPTPGDHVT